MLVDAMTMRMVMKPQTLDTIVATNLHADILSDLAAALAGSPASRQLQHQTGARRAVHVRADHGSAFEIAAKELSSGGHVLDAAMTLEHLGQKPAPIG